MRIEKEDEAVIKEIKEFELQEVSLKYNQKLITKKSNRFFRKLMTIRTLSPSFVISSLVKS